MILNNLPTSLYCYIESRQKVASAISQERVKLVHCLKLDHRNNRRICAVTEERIFLEIYLLDVWGIILQHRFSPLELKFSDHFSKFLFPRFFFFLAMKQRSCSYRRRPVRSRSWLFVVAWRCEEKVVDGFIKTF